MHHMSLLGIQQEPMSWRAPIEAPEVATSSPSVHRNEACTDIENVLYDVKGSANAELFKGVLMLQRRGQDSAGMDASGTKL